jgi:hypothetical protein
VFHLGFLNIPLVSWLPWIVISREIHVRLGEKIHSASVFQSWIWMGACAAMGAAAYAMPSFAALVGKHLYEQWWYLLPLNAWAAIGGALFVIRHPIQTITNLINKLRNRGNE